MTMPRHFMVLTLFTDRDPVLISGFKSILFKLRRELLIIYSVSVRVKLSLLDANHALVDIFKI